ncbi:MAG: DUF3313 domain-containing protein [Geminicoccaceae bacterium]
MLWARFGVFGVCMLLVACSGSKQNTDVTTSGFLGDYSILEPGDEYQAALIYTNPEADWAKYDKILLQPVTIWADPKRFEGVPKEEVQMLADGFFMVISEGLGADYEIVTEPQDNTLIAQVALTDAQSSNPALDTVSSLHPGARVLSEAFGIAGDKPLFVGEVSAEFKATDAMTGELLAAGVDRRVGRKGIGSFDKWNDAKAAIETWTTLTAYRLCVLRDTDCEAPET